MSEPAQNFDVSPTPTTEGMEDIFEVSEQDAPQGANGVRLVANHDELVAPWLSVEQAAERLGLSARAVQKRLKKGTLSGRKEKTLNGERWIIDANELDASQGANIVRLDANNHELIPNSNEPDASSAVVSDKLVRELQAKLEGASYRIGYLEAQLEAERRQVKLLTDSQHKAGWWARFKKWCAGQ